MRNSRRQPAPAEPGAKQRLRTLKGFARRIGLRNREFTIISNNCFAGSIYRRFDLPYQSPTVGLFFFAEDYLTLLTDLSGFMHAAPGFIAPTASRYADYLSQTEPTFGRYPVGLLRGEVEVHFLHYQSEEEARAKWCRRAARIHWDRLIVKFNDQNLCSEAHIRRFDALSFEHKICFTARPFPDCASTRFLQEDEGQPHVTREKQLYTRYLPIKDYLNAMVLPPSTAAEDDL